MKLTDAVLGRKRHRLRRTVARLSVALLAYLVLTPIQTALSSGTYAALPEWKSKPSANNDVSSGSKCAGIFPGFLTATNAPTRLYVNGSASRGWPVKDFWRASRVITLNPRLDRTSAIFAAKSFASGSTQSATTHTVPRGAPSKSARSAASCSFVMVRGSLAWRSRSSCNESSAAFWLETAASRSRPAILSCERPRSCFASVVSFSSTAIRQSAYLSSTLSDCHCLNARATVAHAAIAAITPKTNSHLLENSYHPLADSSASGSTGDSILGPSDAAVSLAVIALLVAPATMVAVIIFFWWRGPR
jgi:hypothetical protein